MCSFMSRCERAGCAALLSQKLQFDIEATARAEVLTTNLQTA